MNIHPALRDKLRPKFLTKAALIVLGTPLISKFPMKGGTVIFINSDLWHLAGLVVLLTAITKIALIKPNGWLWLAFFIYANTFGQEGIGAWIYLILSGLLVWVWTRWITTIPKSGLTTN